MRRWLLRGSACALALTTALVVLSGIHRAAQPAEVKAGAVAHLFEDPSYSVVVSPGHFAWTDGTLRAYPISPDGVDIYVYDRAACIKNGPAAVRLPSYSPRQVIHVAPDEATAMTWNARLQQLVLQKDGYSIVRCYGSVRAAGVGYGDCVAAQADLYSVGFEGCTAVVASNGDWVIFAHALSSMDQDDAGALPGIMRRMLPIIAELGGSWGAWVAGPPESLNYVQERFAEAGVPIVQAIEMDESGHSVFFCRRSQSLTVVPVALFE